MFVNVLTKIARASKLVQMESIDPQVTLEAWEKRGYRGGTWDDPPGKAWENFVHDVDELMMVVTGSLELEVAGKKSYPRPGEEILIAARAVHSVRNRGSASARWLYAYKTRDQT